MARVTYVTQDELDSEYQDLIVSSLQPDKTVNVYAAIGNNEEVLHGLRGFLGALWTHSGLTDRQREIVILTVASEVGSTYEWHQHVNIAPDTGLTNEELTAIARDDRDGLPEEERILIAYARAVARGEVLAPLHEALIEHVNEETAVGVAAIAAGYLALSRLIDALGVEIEEGDKFVGWEPV